MMLKSFIWAVSEAQYESEIFHQNGPKYGTLTKPVPFFTFPLDVLAFIIKNYLLNTYKGHSLSAPLYMRYHTSKKIGHGELCL